MPKEKVSDVGVQRTGKKDWEADYRKSDMETVFRGGAWKSWDQMVDWLAQAGEADNELTPGEVLAMHGDLVRLRDCGVPFTSDSAKAYDLAHKYRHPEGHRGRS